MYDTIGYSVLQARPNQEGERKLDEKTTNETSKPIIPFLGKYVVMLRRIKPVSFQYLGSNLTSQITEMKRPLYEDNAEYEPPGNVSRNCTC